MKARPESAGSASSTILQASRPPAEAPSATIGKAEGSEGSDSEGMVWDAGAPEEAPDVAGPFPPVFERDFLTGRDEISRMRNFSPEIARAARTRQ
jgi:hypothetical protein